MMTRYISYSPSSVSAVRAVLNPDKGWHFSCKALGTCDSDAQLSGQRNVGK